MSSGCGDVLTLEDLQKAKKHQTFEAEVITGKAGGAPGGANIDFATNAVTGQVQKTLPAVLRDAGFRPASFTFDTGGTLTTSDADIAVLWPGPGGDGQYYVWHGALPKVIPAASTPASTGGVSDTAWVPFGDITLREELADQTGGVGVGADMLGYNNRTVKNALDSISNISIKAMSDNDQYNAWPQGKVFSHQSRAFCLYNVGKSHSGDPLAVYQQISDDGVTWTRTAPRIVATDAELATWPQGVSAWGAGSDGANIWVAARFRKTSDESVSKIVLYKSTDGGSSYTKVLDPVPLYDTTTGKAPVLLHSFAVLPNGNIAFGYHFYDGEVGIVQFDPNNLASMTKSVMYTKAEMSNTPTYVEPTLRVYGTKVVGFLRSQNATLNPPIMWSSDDNCATFTKRTISGPPSQSPISLISYNGNTYVFYCGRYRNGNSVNKNNQSPVLTMRVATDADATGLLWEKFIEYPIAAVPGIYSDAGASGTGVQDVCVRGTRMICCLSANTGGNLEQAQVYAVSIDFGLYRDGKFFFTEDAFTNSTRATDFSRNYMYGQLNINNIGYTSAALRFNGTVVANVTTVSTTNDTLTFGGTGTTNQQTHFYRNGPGNAYQSVQANGTNHDLRATGGTLNMEVGSTATSSTNAAVRLDNSDNTVLIRNGNNNQAIKLQTSGTILVSANYQHPVNYQSGSQNIYMWVSGSQNMMYKKGAPPTTDSDGTILF